MNRTTARVALALSTLALLCIGTASRAQLVNSLNTSYNTNVNGTTAAGQFQLTSAATITSATMKLEDGAGDTASELSAALYTDSSNAPGTLIAPGSTGIGTLSGSPSLISFTFGSQNLTAGTYWLELGGSAAGNVGWVSRTSSVVNSGTDGTVLHSVYDNFDGVYSQYALFSISGSLESSTTPEPGVAALLAGLSVSGIGVLARRRRR